MEVTTEDVLAMPTRWINFLAYVHNRGTTMLSDEDGNPMPPEDIWPEVKDYLEVVETEENGWHKWSTNRKGRELLFLANEHGLKPAGWL